MKKTDRTTFIQRRIEMKREPLPECHGGVGALDWTEVFNYELQGGRNLKYVHYDVLAPGVSVGVHEHPDDEEYYYIISGRGTMILDGERFIVEAGDITGVYPGGSHGLENDFDRDLHLLVFCIR